MARAPATMCSVSSGEIAIPKAEITVTSPRHVDSWLSLLSSFFIALVSEIEVVRVVEILEVAESPSRRVGPSGGPSPPRGE